MDCAIESGELSSCEREEKKNPKKKSFLFLPLFIFHFSLFAFLAVWMELHSLSHVFITLSPPHRMLRYLRQSVRTTDVGIFTTFSRCCLQRTTDPCSHFLITRKRTNTIQVKMLSFLWRSAPTTVPAPPYPAGEIGPWSVADFRHAIQTGDVSQLFSQCDSSYFAWITSSTPTTPGSEEAVAKERSWSTLDTAFIHCMSTLMLTYPDNPHVCDMATRAFLAVLHRQITAQVDRGNYHEWLDVKTLLRSLLPAVQHSVRYCAHALARQLPTLPTVEQLRVVEDRRKQRFFAPPKDPNDTGTQLPPMTREYACQIIFSLASLCAVAGAVSREQKGGPVGVDAEESIVWAAACISHTAATTITNENDATPCPTYVEQMIRLQRDSESRNADDASGDYRRLLHTAEQCAEELRRSASLPNSSWRETFSLLSTLLVGCAETPLTCMCVDASSWNREARLDESIRCAMWGLLTLVGESIPARYIPQTVTAVLNTLSAVRSPPASEHFGFMVCCTSLGSAMSSIRTCLTFLKAMLASSLISVTAPVINALLLFVESKLSAGVDEEGNTLFSGLQRSVGEVVTLALHVLEKAQFVPNAWGNLGHFMTTAECLLRTMWTNHVEVPWLQGGLTVASFAHSTFSLVTVAEGMAKLCTHQKFIVKDIATLRGLTLLLDRIAQVASESIVRCDVGQDNANDVTMDASSPGKGDVLMSLGAYSVTAATAVATMLDTCIRSSSIPPSQYFMFVPKLHFTQGALFKTACEAACCGADESIESALDRLLLIVAPTRIAYYVAQFLLWEMRAAAGKHNETVPVNIDRVVASRFITPSTLNSEPAVVQVCYYQTLQMLLGAVVSVLLDIERMVSVHGIRSNVACLRWQSGVVYALVDAAAPLVRFLRESQLLVRRHVVTNFAAESVVALLWSSALQVSTQKFSAPPLLAQRPLENGILAGATFEQWRLFAEAWQYGKGWVRDAVFVPTLVTLAKSSAVSHSLRNSFDLRCAAFFTRSERAQLAQVLRWLRLQKRRCFVVTRQEFEVKVLMRIALFAFPTLLDLRAKALLDVCESSVPHYLNECDGTAILELMAKHHC